MQTYTNRARGFSFTETLVAVALVGILAAVVVAPFASFRKQSILNIETQEVVTLLNKARTSSMHSKNDTQYGVHFETGSISLFPGATYSATSTLNEVHTFDTAVSMSGLAVAGGGSNVVFQKVTGSTLQNATTTLSLVGDTAKHSTIIVYPSGAIAIQ